MPRAPAMVIALRCLLGAAGAQISAGLAQAADLAGPPEVDGTKVGVVGAVNPQTFGQAPAREARTVTLGNDVLFNEHFVTEQTGQAQIFLLDQSSITLGPNSEVTVDEFVYDPREGSGKLATSIAKGLLRYVGGRISKQADVIFTTPTAVIGVRGGIAVIEVAPNGVTRATFLYGERMTVTAGGETQTVLRPGFVVTVDDTGAAPSDPRRVTEEEVWQEMRSFQGPSQSSAGGAQGQPSATDASATQLTTSESVASTSLDDNERRLERRFDNDPDIGEIEQIGGKNRAAQSAQSQKFHQNEGHEHSNHGHKT